MFVMVLEHPRIVSKKRFNDIANTPLWSCLMGGYAAAHLASAGYEVSFIDTTISGLNFDTTMKEILRPAPDLLAINAVYIWENTDHFFRFLSQLRSQGYRGHLNLFGFFPTLAYRSILEHAPSVDSIAVGECETTLVELAHHLRRGSDWTNIAGMASRSEYGIKLKQYRRPTSDPDIFPFPLRNTDPKDTVSILASRGCYNHCSFCPVPSFYNSGPLWRGRSVRNVIEEIQDLLRKGFRDFYFVDPNFVGPGENGRRRTLELLEQIRPLGITFGMETRPNDLDSEMLESLREAGLHSLLLGIESGSSSVLGRLHKGSSRNSSEKAINLCRSFGIEPEIGFLMFVPDSTMHDLVRNFEFLKANNLLDRLDRTANLLCHRQIILKGTRDYSRFEEEGRLAPIGPLGFEGEVSYVDKRVEWISDLVIHACLSVLKDMSFNQSPVYWRSVRENPVSQRVNSYLTSLFQELLREAQTTSHLEPLSLRRITIDTELRKIIGETNENTANREMNDPEENSEMKTRRCTV